MPRARKTQSGDKAQKIESVAGQRYGEGVEQQAMQRAMPAPNRTDSNVPARRGVGPEQVMPVQSVEQRPRPTMDQIAQMMQSLPKGTMRQPTGNDRPVTHGLPTGPGAGPEALSSYITNVPSLRAVELLSRVSDNPLYKDILARFNR